jgi:nucleoid-associated protein YgaU
MPTCARSGSTCKAPSAGARERGDVKTYVVQEGDTLFDIARYQLGRSTRWAEIYELNREALGEDFDFLQPGTELALPAGADEDAITRRPTDRR